MKKEIEEALQYFYLIGVADGVTQSIGGKEFNFEKRLKEFTDANKDFGIEN